jgi:hypothetical protein
MILMNSNNSTPASNNSGNTLVIVAIVIIVLIALGIGGYFMYKSTKACPDNCSDTSCDSKVCTTCEKGYGVDDSMTPDTDGSCPTYTADTSCPTNCSDTKCTNKKCTKCNSGYGTKLAGTPAADGSCPSYYKEYDGIDYRGPANDIVYVPSTDKDDCVSKCVAQTNPSCMFSVTDGTTCWLKNGFGLDAPKGFSDKTKTLLAPVTLQVPPTSSS